MNLRQMYCWVKDESKTWTGTTRHFRENVRVFVPTVVKARSSQVRKIAGVAGDNTESRRRRLQRFLGQAQPLERFFEHWTRSVLDRLGSQPVVLAVDETKLRDALGVMLVGLLVEGRCIPLAWRVYRANSRADYPAEGQVGMILGLLERVKAGLPPDVRVRVVADRGIGTSPDLMKGIIAFGWTFLFRVTKQSKLILPSGEEVTFYDQVQAPGESYHASGVVFKQRGRVPASVHVLWRDDAQQRWSLVTNDDGVTGWEYGERMWIDEAIRDFKSHGWDIEAASLADPDRMARLLIFLVVAYGWMLLLGIARLAAGFTSARKRRPDGSFVRAISLFREGWQAFLTAIPSG